ncbi:PREDICTED: sulfotransferase family cytosolic 1B member 1-like [Amphimedon queenslandica]|uniref:Sulfotransferase domain-containing protein n=2 Tax=Amphimedon queenslandica TaxID=400682 RepID=A0AAN0JQT0_AMPQE|nr:PREDICTED: sulfotransferase family cytosolic 1B member 1-like [Amphimedon queenslandica]|eukprot:XP_019859396.1 PREDICTED: sulfotransferase family cytosolic 1B member 1-like [Amphimedon queenslandica]
MNREFFFDEDLNELPGGIPLLPGMKRHHALELKQKVVPRPDDIFVTSYVRSGTNWVSYIIQLIANGGIPPERDLDIISPCIDTMEPADKVEAMESPRSMKHHYPYDHVAGGPPHQSPAKYIYSYRNPRDVAVSQFLVQKQFPHKSPLTWSKFLDDFIDGNVVYGSPLDNIRGWWDHKDSPNILMLSYERTKKDPIGAVQSISTFLGYQLSQKLIEEIAANSRIDKMKKNLESFNSDLTRFNFVRKGVVGEWCNYFSPQDIKKLDAAVKEKLGDTDIVFDYGDTIDQ